MNIYNNTTPNNTFQGIYSECLENPSKFCEFYEENSINQPNTCIYLKEEALEEFKDDKHFFCQVLLASLFLSRYCVAEHNATIQSSKADCMKSFALPFGLCYHHVAHGDHFLTKEHLICFYYFANYTDSTHAHKMTSSELFWFTMENTCKKTNASRFDVCSGHVYLQENVFNMTKLLQNEIEWFNTKYLYPLLTISVVIINILFVLSIIKTDIIRPTKFIMYALSFVEILGSIAFLPAVVYYIILGNYVSFVPYTVCILIMMVIYVLVPIMHGMFLWLVAGLAIQRLFAVSYPFLASQPKHKHSIERPMAYVLSTGIVLFSVYIPTIQYLSNIPSIEVPMKSDISVSLTTSLLPIFSAASHDGITAGVGVILQKVGAQILPTSILLFVCIRLRIVIIKQKALQTRLSEMSQHQRNPLDQVNTVTLIITAFVLLSEIPNNILAVISCLNYTGVSYIDTSTYLFHTLSVISKVFASISYLANFFACCFGGKAFRDTLKSVLKCSKTDN